MSDTRMRRHVTASGRFRNIEPIRCRGMWWNAQMPVPPGNSGAGESQRAAGEDSPWADTDWGEDLATADAVAGRAWVEASVEWAETTIVEQPWADDPTAAHRRIVGEAPTPPTATPHWNARERHTAERPDAWDGASDRRRPVPLGDQLRALIPLVIVWTILFVGLAIIAVQDRVPVQELFLDPAALDGNHWYSGIVSQFGILAWTVAVCAAAGGAMLADMAGRRKARSFLASGALVTGLLLADDLLQLHSYHVPKYLGFSKESVYAAYLVLVAGWVWWHRGEVMRTRVLVLAAAGLAFLASIIFDQVQLPMSDTKALWFEDSAKFFGIVAFATYFVLTVRDIGWSILRLAGIGRTAGADD